MRWLAQLSVGPKAKAFRPIPNDNFEVIQLDDILMRLVNIIVDLPSTTKKGLISAIKPMPTSK